MEEEIKQETQNVSNKLIKLSEILKICKDFINFPEDTIKFEAYNSMLQTLVIRSYLPMQEKVVALVRMTIDSDKSIDIDSSFFMAGLELANCFDGLLSYVNIEPEIDLSVKNYENYDLIYQSGLADYILQYCEKDYNRLTHMMERTMSFENLKELTESMAAMDSGALKDITETIKNIKQGIDPKVIHDMADIMRYNDPNLYNLNENLKEEALDKLDKMDKVEKVN